jgi:hypothetical protein
MANTLATLCNHFLIKKTPHKAYSKHWDMSKLHKTKKDAVDWLVQTHETAK